MTFLVDVRRYPGSRRHPHFGGRALAAALTEAGIAYRHEEALGGHRAPRAHSPNTHWAEPALRGYADHVATAAFQEALARVLGDARERRTAVMCAEALPSHCHRQILADAALAHGAAVRHLLAADRVEEHVLHPAARLGRDSTPIYVGRGQQVLFPEGA